MTRVVDSVSLWRVVSEVPVRELRPGLEVFREWRDESGRYEASVGAEDWEIEALGESPRLVLTERIATWALHQGTAEEASAYGDSLMGIALVKEKKRPDAVKKKKRRR